MRPKPPNPKAFPWSIFAPSVTSQLTGVLKKAGLEVIDPPSDFVVRERYHVYGRFDGDIDGLSNLLTYFAADCYFPLSEWKESGYGHWLQIFQLREGGETMMAHYTPARRLFVLASTHKD